MGIYRTFTVRLLALSSTMAVSEHKHLMKGSKQGAEKKVVSPFSKED